MDFDAEKIKEIRERAEYKKSPNGICERYAKHMEEYLGSKFPDIPVHEIAEAATYAGIRLFMHINDALMWRDEQWWKEFQRTVPKTARRGSKEIEETE